MINSVDGNIWTTTNVVSPVLRPGNRNRDSAYAAVHDRNTPTTVVASAITTELSAWRTNRYSPWLPRAPNSPRKLSSVSVVGIGEGDSAKSRPGSNAFLTTSIT